MFVPAASCIKQLSTDANLLLGDAVASLHDDIVLLREASALLRDGVSTAGSVETKLDPTLIRLRRCLEMVSENRPSSWRPLVGLAHCYTQIAQLSFQNFSYVGYSVDTAVNTDALRG